MKASMFLFLIQKEIPFSVLFVKILLRICTRSGTHVDCVWHWWLVVFWCFFCFYWSLVPKVFGSDSAFVADYNPCKSLLFSSWGSVTKSNDTLY